MSLFRTPILLSALIAVATAGATTSLEVNGRVIALIGGKEGSYHQFFQPATLTDVAGGSTVVHDVRGSFVDPRDPDLVGDASLASSARFGLLTESAAVSSRGYAAAPSAGDGTLNGDVLDVVTVHGSGAITLTLHTRLAGSTAVSPDANAGARVRQNVTVSPAGFTDNSEIVGFSDDFSGNSVFDSLQSGSITVHDGESFFVIAHLAESAGVDPLDGGLDRPATRTNSASTRSRLDYWLDLPAGASLSSDSGYAYAAPVPEPASWAVLGIAFLAFRRRHRVLRPSSRLRSGG